MTPQEALASLRDGISRPVSMLEREETAKVIDRLLAAIEFAHASGFQWPSDPLASDPPRSHPQQEPER